MTKNKIVSKGTANINLQDLTIGRDLTINQIDVDKLIRKFTKQKDDEVGELREQISEYKEDKNLYKDKILSLEKELSVKIDEKQKLEEKVIKIIEEYRGKDLSTCGKLHQEAFQLFLLGKLNEALDVLDEAKLEEEEKKVGEEEKLVQVKLFAVTDAKRKNAETRIYKAELLSLQYKFDEAEKNYLHAIEIFPYFNSFYKTGYFYYYLN